MRGSRAKGKRPLWALVIILVTATIGFFLAPFSRVGEEDAEKEIEDVNVVQQETWSGRKEIYDREFNRLAVSFRLYSIYARPLEMESTENASRQLAPVLGWDEQELLLALRSERSFVWLGRHVSAAVADQVGSLRIKGVTLIDEIERYYPQRKTGAHVIGFFREEKGLAGIEYYYDAILRGSGLYNVDQESTEILPEESGRKKGAHVVLTVDLSLQELLEKSLERLAGKTGASSATGIVMSPNSGAVLGLACLPTYDPNRFWDYGEEALRNRALADPIFMGAFSGFFLKAAALAREIDAFTGFAAMDSEREENSRPLVEEKEFRTGRGGSDDAAWVAIEDGVFGGPEAGQWKTPVVDSHDLMDFVDLLGFYGPSDIDLPQENYFDNMATFKLENPRSTISPMQLLTALARLVNGGVVLAPHILDFFWYDKTREKVTPKRDDYVSAVNPELSLAMRKVLNYAASTDKGDVAVMESLVVDGVEQEVVGGTLDAVKKSLSDEMKSETVLKESRDSNHFQAVLLGMTPRENPEMVFIIVLEGERFDRDVPSSIRALAQEMAPKMLRIIASKDAGPPAKTLGSVDYDAVYREWASLQKEGEEEKRRSVGLSDGMPRVIGLSLRKALQKLQPLEVEVHVEGSGIVVEQRPLPGASVVGGRVALRLKGGVE